MTLISEIMGEVREGPRASLSEILQGIERHVRRFVVLDPNQATAVILWTAHTHVFAAADCTPYLSITSATKQTGKTRLLEVLESLVREPWLTGRTTAAALVRKVDSKRPTLLLDESDAAFGGEPEYTEVLRGVLNTGYRRSGRVSVCTTAANTVVDFSTFCPKAIAGIGKLPDTVADRSIPIRLRRRRWDEPVQRWRERAGKGSAAPVKASLEAWAKDVNLREARPALPDELSDRAQDCWEPLLAIAEAAGEDWPERARRAAVVLQGEKPSDESIAVELLTDVREAFREAGEPEVMATSALRDALVAMSHRPWAVWGRTGKPVTQHTVARWLSEFGVVTTVAKVGKRSTRVYVRATLEDPWTRYLPTASKPRNPAPDSLAEPAKTGRNQPVQVTTPETPNEPRDTGGGYEVTGDDREPGDVDTRCPLCGVEQCDGLCDPKLRMLHETIGITGIKVIGPDDPDGGDDF